MRIGYRDGLLFDGEQRSWNGLGARPISWAAWYPVTHPDAQPESVAEPPFLPWSKPGAAVPQGALPDDGRHYPVVLLSHGTGGSALGLGWPGRRLAQQSYIVLGANHHGNTHIEPYLAEGFLPVAFLPGCADPRGAALRSGTSGAVFHRRQPSVGPDSCAHLRGRP